MIDPGRELFHVKQHIFALYGVSSQQEHALDCYVHLLEKWATVTNLISRLDLKDVWGRHIADCLALLSTAPSARRWLDLGSGAGLPSVVIAIQLAKLPNAQIYAVESDARKCVFLREVSRQLQIPLRVHNRRAEAISVSELSPIDVITARAYASVPNIMRVAKPFLAKGAIAILPRGKSAGREINELDLNRYSIKKFPGPMNSGGFILHINNRQSSPDLT